MSVPGEALRNVVRLGWEMGEPTPRRSVAADDKSGVLAPCALYLWQQAALQRERLASPPVVASGLPA